MGEPYPNPASNELAFDFSASEEDKVTIQMVVCTGRVLINKV
jgi:hypothetical protein